MQQVVGLQVERTLKETAGRVFHHATGKESQHQPGDDLAIIAGKEQLPVAPRRQKLFAKLLFPNDLQAPATGPVDVHRIIGHDMGGALGKIDGNPGSYRPSDVVSSGLRKFAKERVRAWRQI